MYLVLTVELDGPPDERASAALTQFVDRCAAKADPGHWPSTVKHSVGPLPFQLDVIALSRGYMRAHTLVDDDHEAISAISADSGWLSRSCPYRTATRRAAAAGSSAG